VLDSANDAAIALQEPIKSSPKSSPRAGSPTPSAVRVVVLSCESVATRDNSSVERALIAKLEYLRKINRFDEQHDKNRVVTAGELSQKETLQNDINIAQKQLNQVLDDLRRTQADLVKADAEYQLKLTQLNSIRNKRTNDKAKDQQIEADGRSKMKDGLIAWQLQQITAYEHALRYALIIFLVDLIISTELCLIFVFAARRSELCAYSKRKSPHFICISIVCSCNQSTSNLSITITHIALVAAWACRLRC
jgi:flagellar motility protein MotE (MotC chaperone)